MHTYNALYPLITLYNALYIKSLSKVLLRFFYYINRERFIYLYGMSKKLIEPIKMSLLQFMNI